MSSKLVKKLNKKFYTYLLLFTCSSLTTLIVSTNFVSIHDLAYFLTNGLRISQGQIPYLDFVLVHNPGSFYLVALFIKIFGNSYLPIYLWMYFVNFLTTIMVYQVLIKLKIQNSLLIASLFGILGPYSFLSQIWYDSDSIFFIVLTIYLLFFKDYSKNLLLFNFLVGVISFIPYFVKQNIGLVNIFIINFLLVFFDERPFKKKLFFFFGQLSTILSFIFYLHFFDALSNFYKFTFKQAVNSRLSSFIPEVFPIRIFEKYDLNFQYEKLYLFSYFLVVLISYLLLLNNFKKAKVKIIFSQILISIFSLILYLDILVFKEFVLFIKKYVIEFNFNENYLILLFFIFLSILNVFISLLKLPKKYLESTFITLFLFVTTIISILFIFELFQLQEVEEFVKVSFKYYLLLIFFITFPIIIISFKLKYFRGNQTIFFIIPFLGYIYSTSLSQGLAGSLSGGTGVVVILFFLAIEKFYKKEMIQKFILILSITLFLTAIYGSRYHFIKFENEISSFKELEILKTPSSHYLQQEIAEKIILKYKMNYESIIFVPEATLAYFSTNYKIKADVHTFDSTTNPYSFNYDAYSIANFLNCNNVDLVVINTNNHRVYFEQFVEINNLSKYLGSNYVFKEKYYDFLIYEKLENIKYNAESCRI